MRTSLRTWFCNSKLATPATLSKKVENQAYAVALHAMYYNFVKIQGKLRTSPAMAAGVTDKLLEIGDIAALVEATDAKPAKRGVYKKRTTEI